MDAFSFRICSDGERSRQKAIQEFMKTKSISARWMAVVAAGISLATGYAQVGANNASATRTPSSGSLAHAERAANLYGRELVGSDNQKLGKVDNVIVDLESEHILYVVVGASQGRVAVPPQVIGQTTGNTLHATVTKQKLDSAPKFTSAQDNPTGLGQANFVYQVYQHFGISPWWQGSTPADQGSFHNVHKLNQLIGMNVEDANNQTLGKVSNVVVDMAQGRLVYVVFSPASNLNLGEGLYAMPSDAFTLSGDKKHLVSGIDRQKLAGAPHFDKNSWPNLTDATFASQVYQYYGKQAYFNQGGSNYQPTGR
jgi:sporulation protein YlmC with PRC-barrel domain